MDIYQRICKKELPPRDVKEPTEEEILDSEGNDFVEEEQIPESDMPLTVDDVRLELECMKRRIQKLQLFLKMRDADTCPDEPCVDFEVELTCSENKEICALQKGQYRLQCQIDELVRCCNLAKDQIADLRRRLCEKSREIKQLQEAVCILNMWKNTLEHEFGLCVERFEYLKHVKAEWSAVEDKIFKQRKTFAQLEENFMPKLCYVQDKRYFICVLNELKELFHESHKQQVEKTTTLQECIEDLTNKVNELQAAQKQPKKGNGEKEGNEQKAAEKQK